MTSQNHLTIRDYFHRLSVRHRGGSKGISRTSDFGDGRFHRLLAARQQLSSPAGHKKTGLTIADYRANPVRARQVRVLPRPAAGVQPKGNPSGNLLDPAALRHFSGRCPVPLRHPPENVGASQQVKIEATIHQAARKYDLPAALIKGIIRAESNFQVRAVSHAGARGLMQLMPATARELGVKDSFDIAQNIDGGCRYLRQMLDSFDGDVRLALAAYNAGPGAVIKYGGQVPYRETRQYVDRVLRFSRQMA